MAEKRMFSQKVVGSDAFTEMPPTAQILYFQLNMNADDDGFINSPKKIARSIGASDKDLTALINKRFLISFSSGIVVIKHWRINNTIRPDRYRPTEYQNEFSQLIIKKNKSYTEKVKHPELISVENDNHPVTSLDTNGIPTGIPTDNQMAPQDRIGEDRIGLDLGKDRIEENRSEEKPRKHKAGFVPPTREEVIEYCRQRNSPVDPNRFYDFFEAGHWIDTKGNPVNNWKQKVITWERKEKPPDGRKSAANKPVSGKDNGEAGGAQSGHGFRYD